MGIKSFDYLNILVVLFTCFTYNAYVFFFCTARFMNFLRAQTCVVAIICVIRSMIPNIYIAAAS